MPKLPLAIWKDRIEHELNSLEHLHVLEKDRVVVETVHMVKEYVRPNPQKNIQGGIVEKEGSLPIANVRYYCKECEQGVRIGYKVSENSKDRVCKKCGTVLD